ncbi:LANO_0H11276g1_1 [Lachancea nothofagi CBS 11611]|uniref:LANO_0H11276g1_1 n=1 Tax=Lachancea nothofagi CBS 11611 TaxID=1266666 RepID=A0A1G4KMA4_9SACH|nr:LANO_0H11276g1_1 [Lachancea nothofagi CBS 11611]
MGAAYTIFGKTVQPHVLALATIVGTVGGAAYKMSGGSEAKETTPAPQALTVSQDSADLDVEKMLDSYLKETEKK